MHKEESLAKQKEALKGKVSEVTKKSNSSGEKKQSAPAPKK